MWSNENFSLADLYEWYAARKTRQQSWYFFLFSSSFFALIIYSKWSIRLSPPFLLQPTIRCYIFRPQKRSSPFSKTLPDSFPYISCTHTHTAEDVAEEPSHWTKLVRVSLMHHVRIVSIRLWQVQLWQKIFYFWQVWKSTVRHLYK